MHGKANFKVFQELKYSSYRSRHIDYCMEKIRFLIKCGITPFVVLDGGHLPMKANEETGRQK